MKQRENVQMFGFNYLVIDASIKWADGKYYMAIKREDGGQAYNNGGYGTLIMASADRLIGSWSCSEEFVAGKLAPNNTSKNWCEGPTWSKSYADGLYYLYFDEARGRDVVFATNTDMANDSGWKYYDDSEYGGIATKKIHGNTQTLDDKDKQTSHCGITDITQKELDRLIAKWGVTSEAYGIWFTILNAKNPETVEVVKGSAFDAMKLPKTVSVQYDDGGWRDVAVTWDENDYDASADSCTLTGTIDLADDVRNSNNITVTCTVCLTEIDKSELSTAIKEAESKTETDYCAGSWKAMQATLAAATEVNEQANATQEQVNTEAANLNAALKALQRHEWSTAWSKGEDTHWHECSNCHAKKDETAHTPGPAATEHDPQICTECGYIIAPATGHIHHTTTLVPTVEATCISEGHKAYYTCSGCSDWFEDAEGTIKIEDKASVVIGKDPTNHVGDTEIRDAKQPSYTEEGYTGDTYCKSCNAKIAEGHVIPKLVKPSNPSGGTVRPVSPNAGVNKKPEAEKKELPFTDVPQTAWYQESVQKAWEIGLIDGVTKTQFQPDGTLTVAQAIKLAAALYQMEHEGEVTLSNGRTNWYDSYVSYAVANGIIEKDYASYTAAQMNAAITRAEFVHIFHGAESTYKAINQVADDAIPDVKTGDAFASDIYEFYRAGILTGSNAKGTFHPASSIKRSEVSAILVRMFDTASRQSITLQ